MPLNIKMDYHKKLLGLGYKFWATDYKSSKRSCNFKGNLYELSSYC